MIHANIRRLGVQLFSLILLFGIVYNVNFQIAPTVTMGRAAVLYLLWEQRKILSNRLSSFAAKHPYVLLILLALLFHATIGYLMGGREDSTQMSRQFHFLLYSILASYLYASHLRGDLQGFLRNFAIVGFVQGVFIIYSLFSPEYRQWLANLVVQNSNFPLTLATRPPGFSTGSGANFSVIQSLGVFCCLWIAFESKSWWTKILGSFGAIVTIISALLAGRTGLMLSGLFMFAFCLRDVFRLRFRSVAIVSGLLLTLVIQGPTFVDYLMENRSDDLPDFRRISEWAFEFFMNDGQVYSINDLETMPVPKLSFETLVGTGLVENGSRNDSGFIQNYFALGLVMAIVFYSTVFYLFLRMWLLSQERLLSLALIFGIIFIEVKEPFILKYIYVFFIMTQYYQLSGMKITKERKSYDQLLTQ